MTIIIIILLCIQVLSVIHHIIMIEQLKTVKRNQFNIHKRQLECLDCIDDTMVEIYAELKEINQPH